MTPPEPSPLTAEEQALAQRLSRVGGHAEPSPALDARVLAAAHAAAQEAAAPPVLRRRRWPAIAGLAASLVLAVGLAWQLRPEPPAPSADADREPAAAVSTAQSPTRPPEQAPAEDARASVAAPAPSAKPASVAGALDGGSLERQRRSPAPPTVADTPSPMSLPPPPPPAEPVRDEANAAVSAPAPAAPPVAPVVSKQSVDADEAEQATASGSHPEDEPTDDVPPATVDSPEVRDAWLDRIHRLVDAGDIVGARASLREFARRYPDYPLPEDLRALGQ